MKGTPKDSVRIQATEIWKILGKYEKKRIAEFPLSKIPLSSIGRKSVGQAFPNLSLAVLGVFNGLARKIFGEAFFRFAFIDRRQNARIITLLEHSRKT